MDELRKKKLFQLGNLVVPLIVGLLSAILSGDSGSNWREVFSPDEYDKLLGPAGITFAIWGPIFIFIGAYVLYQARDIFKPKTEQITMPYVFQVNIFLMISIVAASSWYVFWAERNIWLAFLSMVIFLISVLVAYFRLNINLTPRTFQEHLFITIGWSLFAGWVTAANLVSLTTVMIEIGFETIGITEVVWTLAILIAAVLVYSIFLITRNDFIYASVGIWVLVGVIIERVLADILYLELVFIAVIGIFVLIAEMVYVYFNQNQKIFPISQN